MANARRTAALLLLIGSVLGMPADGAQTSEAFILALEQRFNSGLLDRDEKKFGELLSEDLVHIGFEGQIASKGEYMTFFRTGTWQYLRYQPSQLSVKLLGNAAAVVTGRVDRVIRINDREISGTFAFTHVWSGEGDTWRLRSSHVTTVPQPGTPTP